MAPVKNMLWLVHYNDHFIYSVYLILLLQRNRKTSCSLWLCNEALKGELRMSGIENNMLNVHFCRLFFCRYMYLIVNQNLSLIDPLLQILLSYLMNLKEVFFFGPESGQWCLQETVSQTERGATKSDVL